LSDFCVILDYGCQNRLNLFLVPFLWNTV